MNKKIFFITVLIFLTALTVRVFSVKDMSGMVLQGDSHTYDQLAMNILNRAEFGNVSGIPFSYRPPLYPAFLATIYFFLGHNFLWVGVTQAIIGALTCVFIYFLGKDIFNHITGIIAGFISSFYMYFVASSRFLMSEVLFIFLFTVSIYYLNRGLKDKSLKYMGVSGFLLGLSALSRPVTLFYPFFIFLFMFLGHMGQVARFKVIMRRFILLLVLFLIPVSIWTTRNYLVHKTLVPISTNGGINFFIGNTPDENDRLRVRGPLKEEAEELKPSDSEIVRNNFFFQKALRYMAGHPKVVAKLMFVKFFFFWSPFEWFFFGQKGVYNYHYGFILPFALAAMCFLIKRWREYWVLYVPIFYILSLTVIVHVEPRYRMPIEPFLIIFFSYGIFLLFRKFANKWVPVFISVGLFVVNFLAYLHSDIIKEGIKYCLIGSKLW